jgi:thiol-disulfide isomerase/thioredoxin
MKKRITFVMMLFFGLHVLAYAQNIKEYSDISDFYNRLNSNSDTNYVVNFWATWCGPCVEELPHFLDAESNLKDKPVKFIYLSMDFKKHINSRLIPFVKKNFKANEVAILTDTDTNRYIPMINEKWDGAIPATLIFSKGKTVKFEATQFENKESIINFIQSTK